MSDDQRQPSRFTDREVELLRRLVTMEESIAEIVEQQRRLRWLQGVVRNMAAWLAVVLGGIVAVWMAWEKLVKAALK